MGGKDGALPWRLPGDMKFFKRVTTAADEGRKNAVVMGRKTWDSIPEKFRPLPGRYNVVLTRSAADSDKYPDDVIVASSMESALERLRACADIGEVFAIGGESVYREILQHPGCKRLFITRVGKDF